jgi:hypothetical protein
MPSGSWHATTAGDEGSLSLHLRLPPTPVRVLIERALERVAALDRPLPLSPSLGAGGAPTIVKDALASALAAVSVELTSLPLEGYEWAALHRELLTEAATRVDAIRPAELEPGHALRWTAEGLAGCVVATDRDGARRIAVHVHGAEVAFDDAALVAYAEKLLGAPRFVAGDTVAWLPRDARSWPQAQALLCALVSIGALERGYSRAEASGSSRPISSTRRR